MTPRQINLFEPEIKRFQGRVKPKTLKKVRDITQEFSDAYINNHPGIHPQKIEQAMEELYGGHGTGGVKGLPKHLAMSDEEARYLDELRARLTPDEIREMADAGYTLHGYSQKAIASNSGKPRAFNADPAFVPGLAWLHRSNDLAGSVFSGYAKKKGMKTVRILDLGGGTGGTTESIAAHLTRNLPKDTRIHITTMEQNDNQLLALREKVKTLLENQGIHGRVCITVKKGNMLDVLKELKSGQYHGAIAAYSTHHIHDTEKKAVAENVHRLLAPGAAYLVNDCDGLSDINR
ncbi:MAG: class I SAM-dependent methyltransferase, partial [Candidatus Micrarchaeota archaeon]|nr:class I SAM-dependent methyltransferase [Candidatus Micrarchaeota archaeon]